MHIFQRSRVGTDGRRALAGLTYEETYLLVAMSKATTTEGRDLWLELFNKHDTEYRRTRFAH